MNKESEPLIKIKEQMHGTMKSYLVGFFLSIFLTLGAFFLVSEHLLQAWSLTWTIIALAFVQVLVQLFFFLHLGDETRPYWNMIAFIFMVLVVLIIVIGSLWIMYNLDYNMMGKT